MAIVDVGKTHSESISVSVFQSGTNRCDVNLKNALFGDTVQSDQYTCAVQSLQVPLDGTTYLSDQPENALLCSLRRRQDGAPYDPYNTHLLSDNPGGAGGEEKRMQGEILRGISEKHFCSG